MSMQAAVEPAIVPAPGPDAMPEPFLTTHRGCPPCQKPRS